MTVIHVNFKYGVVLKPDDEKNCLNCIEYHTGVVPKKICLACTRFGHTDGITDNWKPQGKSDDTENN